MLCPISLEPVFLPLPLSLVTGIGVDDVYIVLMAIKKQGGYTKRHWLKAMREVAVPVTMTSLVNASMFAILNLSDIPAVYLTSRVACYCIICLYLTVMFCFPAYCYLDLKRQEAGRVDGLVCVKSSRPPMQGKKEDVRSTYLYHKFYKPVVLNADKKVRSLVHFGVFLVSIILCAVGIYGITQRDIGLGLEDFFPSSNPSNRWAVLRTEQLGAWNIQINWGRVDYTDPNIQMRIIKQYEDVLDTPYVSQVETKQLWLADFTIWTSRHCFHNFARKNFDELQCGRDQAYEDGSYCAGTWVQNKFGLREKNFKSITDDTCLVSEGGICRPWNQMHIEDLKDIGLDEETAEGQVFCPVIDGWSDEKWKFCLKQWRNITDSGQRFVLEDPNAKGSPQECSGVYNQDEDIVWPIPFSDGPFTFAINLNSHQTTLDMMEQTRAICDDDPEVHCWMAGIPYDYWQQYNGIFELLLSLAGYATLAGFVIAATFLFGKLYYEHYHPARQILIGSLIAASLIAITIVLTLITVVGLSVLVGVNLTGFSNLAFILSVGFTVEYSVHIISRWMRANMSYTTSLQRVHHTMSFLMLPTFMSFVSSTIGVVCLAFTDFEFNRVFFFRPLMIVMFVSYWFGCWFLPVLLTYLDFDVLKLGKPHRGPGAAKAAARRSDSSPSTTPASVPDMEPEVIAPTLPSEQPRFVPDTRYEGSEDGVRRKVHAPDPPTGPTILVAPSPDDDDSGEADEEGSADSVFTSS